MGALPVGAVLLLVSFTLWAPSSWAPFDDRLRIAYFPGLFFFELSFKFPFGRPQGPPLQFWHKKPAVKQQDLLITTLKILIRLYIYIPARCPYFNRDAAAVYGTCYMVLVPVAAKVAHAVIADVFGAQVKVEALFCRYFQVHVACAGF